MSENIRGITFAEQAVTPADDAIVRRAILGDGVLTGCEVTYSGSTLTLAPGYIIACGRSFQITTAQNFAVVDATSGVARLLLTIDLTQTATEETFNQISFSIEYAAAEDGFVDLIQDDINLAGTKYQIVCAVVSLGTGGITGIVSKLERTEGGGGGLNFKVVPGLTQPGTASENTIWVTTERIGVWYFSATQPEGLQEWDVWFPTGTESDFAFNALRKNAVQVYPLSAKQMVGGALAAVTAMRYQGGEWVEWIPSGALFWRGDECIRTTGGWQLVKQENQIGGTVTVSGSELVVDGESTAVAAIAMCKSYDGSRLGGKNHTRVLVSDLTIKSGGVCFLRIFKSLTDQTKLAEIQVKASGEYQIPLAGISSGQVAVVCYLSTAKVMEIEVV